jgi:hypothetical protein
LVVLNEAPADFAGLNPNHRVLSRGISQRAMKHLSPDGAFLELLGVTVELAKNYIAKELFAAVCAFEVAARQNIVKLLKHFRPASKVIFRRAFRDPAVLRRFEN